MFDSPRLLDLRAFLRVSVVLLVSRDITRHQFGPRLAGFGLNLPGSPKKGKHQNQRKKTKTSVIGRKTYFPRIDRQGVPLHPSHLAWAQLEPLLHLAGGGASAPGGVSDPKIPENFTISPTKGSPCVIRRPGGSPCRGWLLVGFLLKPSKRGTQSGLKPRGGRTPV